MDCKAPWVGVASFALGFQCSSAVVVEERSKAGLQQGDRIISYDGKTISSPAAFDALQQNTFGKNEIVLQVQRGGESLNLTVPLGALGIEVRPELPASALTSYEEGKVLLKAGKTKEAAAHWKAAARSAQEAWLFNRAGEILENPQLWKEAVEAHLAAWELLKDGSDDAAASNGNSTGTVEHTVTYATQSHQWTLLPDISGYPYNEGYGISDEGVAVGNAFSSSGSSVAWIWDPKTLSYSFFTVPGADANSTSPSGLNDKGQIAGYYSTGMGSAYHGFLREYGTYTTIDAPGASYTFLDGLNNSGIIQGQIYDAAGAAEGFVASSGGVFTIVNDTNATNTALVGINDHGDVCGSYWDTFGINTAFVALRL